MYVQEKVLLLGIAAYASVLVAQYDAAAPVRGGLEIVGVGTLLVLFAYMTKRMVSAHNLKV